MGAQPPKNPINQLGLIAFLFFDTLTVVSKIMMKNYLRTQTESTERNPQTLWTEVGLTSAHDTSDWLDRNLILWQLQGRLLIHTARREPARSWIEIIGPVSSSELTEWQRWMEQDATVWQCCLLRYVCRLPRSLHWAYTNPLVVN